MQRKTILVRRHGKLWANTKLTNRCCRWPIGDPRTPDFGFCGKQKIPGTPYCPVHLPRSIQPLRLSDSWLPAAHFPQGGPTDRTRELASFDDMGEKGDALVRVKESA